MAETLLDERDSILIVARLDAELAAIRATTSERGGPPATGYPSWPKELRTVRAWLTPRLPLHRYRQAWADKPPPHELQQHLNAVANGHALNLY